MKNPTVRDQLTSMRTKTDEWIIQLAETIFAISDNSSNFAARMALNFSDNSNIDAKALASFLEGYLKLINSNIDNLTAQEKQDFGELLSQMIKQILEKTK
jgi:hypothetical protein